MQKELKSTPAMNFNRTTPVFASLMLTVLPHMLALCLVGCNSPPNRPNVLFIAVDDLRPELNCYGQSRIHSPNINALAGEGVLFRQAYCNVPVCGASRASLMTGLRPSRHRFLRYYSRADEDAPGITTLPGHFRRHGYYTISNGKIFHDMDDSRDAWNEIWRPAIKTSWRDYQLMENILKDTANRHRGAAWEAAEGPDSMYFDGKIALKSVRDLRKLKQKQQPFFLAVGFLKPHLPFNAPARYWSYYDRESIKLPGHDTLPAGVPERLITNWGELRSYDGIPDHGPVTEETAVSLVQGYYACVSYTDAQVGKLLDALKELKLSRNTIVILWGDHGWNLREHGLWCKHCSFNTSLRTTLILKVPGKTCGAKTNSLVEFVDIYPTLSELCSLPLPSHLEGKSMVPILKDPGAGIRDFTISKWNDGLTIQTRDYAYTQWFVTEDSVFGEMLYDHRSDPDEIYNLAGLPDYEQLADSLGDLLHLHKGRDYFRPMQK